MSDAETVMGETGVIYVCAVCGIPVESEPCAQHQPAQRLESYLASGPNGAPLKVPGFDDWRARPQINGFIQDETGWSVTSLFLAEMMIDAGFDLDKWLADHEPADNRTEGD